MKRYPRPQLRRPVHRCVPAFVPVPLRGRKDARTSGAVPRCAGRDSLRPRGGAQGGDGARDGLSAASARRASQPSGMRRWGGWHWGAGRSHTRNAWRGSCSGWWTGDVRRPPCRDRGEDR